MDSHIAVNDPSSRRPSSPDSESHPHTERRCSHQAGMGFGTLDFAHTHTDGSPHRASASSFEADLTRLQSQHEDAPSAEASVAANQPTIFGPQLPDGIDDDLDPNTAPPPVNPTSNDRLHQLNQLPLPSFSGTTERVVDGLPEASNTITTTSANQPQTPVPALATAFEDQRATPPLPPPPHNPTTTNPPQRPLTLQRTISRQSQQLLSSPRDRRRQRFVRWLQRRFRRQTPWSEGWFRGHRRGGSQGGEATRAIRRVEDAGL